MHATDSLFDIYRLTAAMLLRVGYSLGTQTHKNRITKA